MTETLSRRQHTKRYPGITETMRNTLLQAHRQSHQNGIMDDLMNKLNASPKRVAQPSAQEGRTSPQRGNTTQLQNGEKLHITKHHDQPVSVSRQMGALLRPAQNGLKRVLSLDKASLRMNASRLGRRGKKHAAGLLGQPAAVLSKKSTGYSTQSEEEALKEENERMRELCLAEEDRMQWLVREIEKEKKVQLIRRQLFEEGIKRLKRKVGEGESEGNPDSI